MRVKCVMQVKCQVYLCGICKCYCGNKELPLFCEEPWNTLFLNCHNLKILPTSQVHCHVDENSFFQPASKLNYYANPFAFLRHNTHTHTPPQWEQAQCSTSVNSSFCHFTSHGVHMSHNKPPNKAEPIICLPNEVKVSINIVL